MHEEPSLLEPDELLQLPDGDSYELVDGRLEEKKMGAESNEIAGRLFGNIYSYVRMHRLGHLFMAETGFQCFPLRPKLVRKPDVAFVASGRFADEQSPKGHIVIVPDLAVEAVSPNDTYDEVDVKVGEYLRAGVRLVWIVSPATKTVLVRRPNKTCTMLDVRRHAERRRRAARLHVPRR